MASSTLSWFHVYYHSPDPVPLDALSDDVWLIGNGATYQAIAYVQARTQHDAWRAWCRFERAGFGPLRRADHPTYGVELLLNMLPRPAAPGDVLLGDSAAWMLDAERTLRPLIYHTTPAWQRKRCSTEWSDVRQIVWSPDGTSLATATGNGIRFFPVSPDDPEGTAPDTTYIRHKDSAVEMLAWSPDGTRMASGDRQGDLHLWHPDPQGGWRRGSIGPIVVCPMDERYEFQKEFVRCCWTPDGRLLCTARRNGYIQHWDAATGRCVNTYAHSLHPLSDLVCSPCAPRLASVGEDALVRVWSLDTPEQTIIYGHSAGDVLAWSPDGKLLAVVDPQELAIHLWHPATGTIVEVLSLSRSCARSLQITALAWSPDGMLLAAGCTDGTVQILDVWQGRHRWTFRQASVRFRSLAWSPDGALLAAGGATPDGALTCWIWHHPDQEQHSSLQQPDEEEDI